MDDASPCPPEYDPVATGTCHRIVATGADWLTAEQDCEEAKAYVCEYDGTPADPTAY